MKHYLFREARLSDVVAIGRIFQDAVARMISEGKKQWNEIYPTEEHAIADIRHHNGYVLECDGEVEAYGAVIFTGEPAYEKLRGEWLADTPYVVVHRLAVSSKAQGRGLACRFFSAVEHLAVSKGIGSFRVDTNFDNERMLCLLDKCGFEYCGDITYECGDRRAFEKLI